ncbi:MAG: dienelactone hydrolase family protein, partial [Granulicella sp.]
MGSFTTLKATDGHELKAYIASPEGTPKGAIVVVQEIFGVNAHVRSVADGYAKDGFLAIAPALFDRYERSLELKYDGEDKQKAYDIYGKLNPDTALLDIAAAFAEVAQPGNAQPVFKTGVLGFCWGGLMSWLTATRAATVGIHPACAVAYYPGGIGKFATEQPTCPVMVHVGKEDTHIAGEQLDAVRQAHPESEVEIYRYE